jgi:hypothetical protein
MNVNASAWQPANGEFSNNRTYGIKNPRLYLGTLNIAIRLFAKLIVCNSVPTKTRFFPFTIASLHPVPLVIRSPLRAFFPLMLMSVAMTNSFVGIAQTTVA